MNLNTDEVFLRLNILRYMLLKFILIVRSLFVTRELAPKSYVNSSYNPRSDAICVRSSVVYIGCCNLFCSLSRFSTWRVKRSLGLNFFVDIGPFTSLDSCKVLQSPCEKVFNPSVLNLCDYFYNRTQFVSFGFHKRYSMKIYYLFLRWNSLLPQISPAGNMPISSFLTLLTHKRP